MKLKKFVVKLIVAIPWLLNSCDNVIDPVLPSDPVPVVYCVFNPMDTAYYVSITKSFQGDTDAFILAKNPDLIFYDSAQISLKGIANDHTVLFETNFVPYAQNKVKGIFAQTGGYLFKSVKELDRFNNFDLAGKYSEIAQFKLEVKLPGYNGIIESFVKRIRPAYITNPPFDSIDYDFYSYNTPIIAVSSGAKDYKDCMDFVMRFRYKDHYADSVVLRELDILFRRNIYHTSYAYFTIPPDLLLNQLARHSAKFEEHAGYRTFFNFDFISYNATTDFQRYLDTWVLTTSDYHMVDFSNLTNARGLFSMKNAHVRYNFHLDKRTLDSIAKSKTTATLRFVNFD